MRVLVLLAAERHRGDALEHDVAHTHQDDPQKRGIARLLLGGPIRP
jgi:hypothetical protein